MRRCLPLWLFIGVVLFAAPLAQAAEPAPVVRVNDAVLTENDLQGMLRTIIPASTFHSMMTEEKIAAYRKNALNEMIDLELLYQEALKRGMQTDQKVIKQTVEKAITRLGGKKKFRATLKAEGITEKQFKRNIEKRFLSNRLLDLEVAAKASVTEEEIKAYYELNKKSFFRPEARILSHILIGVSPTATANEKQFKRERAAEVLRKLGEGEDFGRLAWDYSNDAFRVKGGNMGLIHRGRLDETLEAAVFGLEKGALSGIIETIYGFHIVKVEDVKETEQLSFEEASQSIEKNLKEKKLGSLKGSLLASLKEKASIVIY